MKNIIYFVKIVHFLFFSTFSSASEGDAIVNEMAAWLGKPSVEIYNDIHLNDLPLNYAYVILNTTLDHIGVYSVSEDCYKCPYKRQTGIDRFSSSDKNAVFEVYTGEQTKWRILNHIQDNYIHQDYKRGLLCDLKPTLEEYGVYRLDIGKCAMETEVPPVNVYLPLLFFSLIMFSGLTILALTKLFLRRSKRYNDGLNLTAKRDNLDIMPSLHFLRGLLLIVIIFVTAGGGGYPIFSKNYGGLTVANCLLFAYTLSIGLKVPIMFEEDSKRAISKWFIFCVVFLRSLVLLFVAIAISKVAPRSRYLGAPLWAPVPCIALCYLMVTVFYIISSEKRDKNKNSVGTAGKLSWSWFLGAFLLAVMIVSIHIFYYTECEQYTEFDPQRNSWMANGNNCQEDDEFSEVFNKNLLRVNRDEPFYIDSFYAFTQGILGIISCLLTALIGLNAGVIYVQNEDHKNRMKQWYFLAVVSGAAGVILAAVSGPLHFNLWPLSSIFFVSSATLFLYITIYYFTELLQFSSNTITTYGVASIATLSSHLLFSHSFPFYWGEYLDTHLFYLWQSTWVVFLWVMLTICWMKLRTYLIKKVSDEGTWRSIFAW